MGKSKLAIIYYSTYGTNYQLAQVAEEAANQAGAEVRLLRVPETAPQEVVDGQEAWKAQQEKMAHVPEVGYDDMEWADAYLFSTPTRYGVPASQMRAFIDTLGPLWQEGKLANKAVTAMTSAQNTHGGQETTLISLYTTFMHWGSIIVSTGYTDESITAAGGNPYGTSVNAGLPLGEAERSAVEHQTRRLIDVAARLRTESEVAQAA